MIRFFKSHICALVIVAAIAAALSAVYLPLWKLRPDLVPEMFRGVFIIVSMPWSWLTVTPLDWAMNGRLSYFLVEGAIAVGFGINVALLIGAAWFAMSRGNSPGAQLAQ